MFQELSNFKGWDQLAEYARAQVKLRNQQVVAPAGSLDGLIQQEYMKGEMAGIDLFMRFPEIVERDFGEQIEEFLSEIKETNDGN